MKIALAAATGKIGRHIAAHAIARGHDVTAIVRRDTDLPPELDGARIVIAPLADHDALVAAVRGHDVLASAYGPQAGAESTLVDVSDALIAAAREAGVPRVVVVGGAGSLEVAPGVQLVDVPDFPAAYKPVALAHREALKRFQNAGDLAWTFFSPAAEIGPGEARGRFRTQAGALLADADGKSAISYADYADAFVTELEQARHPRQIITAAY